MDKTGFTTQIPHNVRGEKRRVVAGELLKLGFTQRGDCFLISSSDAQAIQEAKAAVRELFASLQGEE